MSRSPFTCFTGSSVASVSYVCPITCITRQALQRAFKLRFKVPNYLSLFDNVLVFITLDQSGKRSVILIFIQNSAAFTSLVSRLRISKKPMAERPEVKNLIHTKVPQ